MFNKLITASGAELYESGFRYDDDESTAGTNDFEYVGGGDAGYILTPPSGFKHYVKAIKPNGESIEAIFRTYFEAQAYLLKVL